MKTTVIYHRADYDGLFSAAVCKKFLPDAEFIGWDFGDPLIPCPVEGPIYVVDLPPDCMAWPTTETGSPDFPARKDWGARLIWIDHHKSSIDKWDEKIDGYRIDGVAACRLCWQWFTYEPELHDDSSLPEHNAFVGREVQEPLALTLAGEYDVWDKRDERADPFQFGLTSLHPSVDALIEFLGDDGDDLTDRAVRGGRFALEWQKEFATQVCEERSYVREWEGRTFCILASCHARNSMWFPQEAIPKECDALMCWRYDGNRVSFSLYHAPGHEEHDLSQIAVKYGGGGHRGACGFSMSLDEALEVIR